MMEDDSQRHLILFSIAPIIVKPINDELLLFGIEEFPGLCREVDDEEPADYANANRNSTLDYENP